MLLFLKWRDAIRLIMSFAIGGVFGLATAADPAAGYPSRPIRFVASTTAGGGNDILPRLLGMHMAANWNQQVIVDLRPGAAAIVGTQLAAHAVPDGYTLIVISNTYSLNPSLYEKLPYDTLKDLDRVSLFAVAPLVLVAHPTVPAQSLPEVIRLLQAKPGQINYGSSGVGTGGWLSAQLFRRLANVEMTHVPYKGAGQATAAIVSGEVQLLFTSSLPAMPHIKSGRLRALGVTSAKRARSMENVPAIGEVVPGYELLNYFGVLVTGGTPRPIIAKLHHEIRRIIALPVVKAQFDDLGVEPVDYGPEQFTAFVKADISKWAKIFAESGIKPTSIQ